MHHTPNSKNYFARTLALGLACCLVLFAVQIVVHGHEKGHNEACRVCHAAHLGAAPAVNAFLLAAPVPTNDGVREIAAQIHKELFAHDAPSRAPPAA